MSADYKKLIDMVKKGVTEKEIMKEMGIRSRTLLRRMYYDALAEAGKIKGYHDREETEKSIKTGEKTVDHRKKRNHPSEQAVIDRSTWLQRRRQVCDREEEG